MSIHSLSLVGLPNVTMRYEDGGKFEVYKYNDKEIRFGAGAPLEQVVAAFKEDK